LYEYFSYLYCYTATINIERRIVVPSTSQVAKSKNKRRPAKLEDKPQSNLRVVSNEDEAPVKAIPPPLPRERQTATYSPDLKIKFTGAPNPVRAGTNRAQIWSLFQDNMTVGSFDSALKATDKRGKDNKTLVGGHGDLKIAVEKGYIELV
jgi:hypothetical protein